MDSLRDLLKMENVALHDAFLDLLKYLENAILPLMGSDGESLNSIPHLKNNENYLQSILPLHQHLFDKKQALYLSPHELYALLASIYLHDIGRIKRDKGHGNETQKMILTKNLWKELDIPNKEMAEAIGMICDIHEPDCKKDEEHPIMDIFLKADEILVEIKGEEIKEVNEFNEYSAKMLDGSSGVIRVNELGSLLSLVDNMDATYRRLIHLQVLNKLNYSSPVSLLRDCIKSVALLPDCNVVLVSIEIENENYRTYQNEKVVITHKSLGDNVINSGFLSSISQKIYNNPLAFKYYLEKRNGKCLFSNIEKKFGRHENLKTLEWLIISGVFLKNYWIELKELKPKDFQRFLYEAVHNDDKVILNHFRIINNTPFICANAYLKYKNIIDNKIRSDYEKFFPNFEGLFKETDENIKLPAQLLLPMILGNIRSSHFSLQRKYRFLSRLGINIQCWLINVDEHLYNYLGEETYEPVFTKDYLKHVAKTMWQLSTRIFGKSFLTYEMLASAACEKDLNMIKLAVKRLEIISRLKNGEQGYKGLDAMLNYTSNGWQWESKADPHNNKLINYNDSDLIEIINDLGDPQPNYGIK